MKLLDCRSFKGMIQSAANHLENKQDEIDKLNVFPVPDGDTGTNMKMTFVAGVNETVNYLNDFIGDTAKHFSRNMLMGARGNSGVILSQIFKGFASSLKGLQKANVNDIANAFVNGSRIAYKAVMRPVEGTILTVAREMADYGKFYVDNNPRCTIEQYFDYILKMAQESLERTPDLLPVLKEVGVVDSGGAGFVTIVEGMNLYLQNKPVKLLTAQEISQVVDKGYCVEVLVSLNDLYKREFSIERLTRSLGRTCNDINVVKNNNDVVIHVHTSAPGDIINTAHRFGSLEKVKVEKYSSELDSCFSYQEDPKLNEHKKYAIISVCNGDGIKKLFESLNVDYIIHGGQTMNPATEDFVNILNKLNAENVFILPNNSNIFLAANQAKDIVDDKNVYVLETKSIPQGISACINFNSEAEVKENLENMNMGIASIKTGSITKAIKDTSYNSLKIKKDNYMGISDKDVLVATDDLLKATYTLLDKIIDEDCGYVTIIYGSQTDEATAQKVLDYIEDKHDLEGQLVDGQQDLYPFILGVE
ncbi:MAG: DAK2 domain-containing protein [Bacillota bacterium]|mgnify:CR=1 FL=1|jgi:DAK2 domain fusion protein YloV|nr:DAK2 domain-containing protein [Bacillota bacterium]NLL26389.1 DAK2 domain-containing protein [Erysipelotrichia bacterium]